MRPSVLNKREPDLNKSVRRVSRQSLKRWPLPDVDQKDKEARGRVLILAGCGEMPGAAILPAFAALRVGAGKLQIATPKAAASVVAGVVHEAMVMGLPQARGGGVTAAGFRSLLNNFGECDTLLAGPGMDGDKELFRFLRALRAERQTVVLDAGALKCLIRKPEALAGLKGRAIITPHAGEMAEILGAKKPWVERHACRLARDFASESGLVTVLKGEETFIASPEGEVYCNRAGNSGLATSGSGDVLAGLIAGLAARGASACQAATWGVFLHATAGDRLAKRIGPLGFLARELLAEVPRILNGLS